MPQLDRNPREEGVLEERLKTEPNNADILFTLAAINAVHGQYGKAIKRILKLETIDSKYPGLWRLKDRIYELMGDVETAAIFWEMGKDGFK